MKNQYSRPDSIRVKARSNYQCEVCGDTFVVQAHAPNGDHSDWHKGFSLCGNCHANQHPNVPRNIFLSRTNQPYWPNISARALARQFNCHSRTIIRRVKRLQIPTRQTLTIADISRLRSQINYQINYQMAKCNICGHEWQVRTIHPDPCPKCLIAHWREEEDKYEKIKCVNCGYEWRSQMGKPKSCPRCKLKPLKKTTNKHRHSTIRIACTNGLYKCPDCRNTHTVKHGKYMNKIGYLQRRKCQDCGATFYEIPLDLITTP